MLCKLLSIRYILSYIFTKCYHFIQIRSGYFSGTGVIWNKHIQDHWHINQRYNVITVSLTLKTIKIRQNRTQCIFISLISTIMFVSEGNRFTKEMKQRNKYICIMHIYDYICALLSYIYIMWKLVLVVCYLDKQRWTYIVGNVQQLKKNNYTRYYHRGHESS